MYLYSGIISSMSFLNRFVLPIQVNVMLAFQPSRSSFSNNYLNSFHLKEQQLNPLLIFQILDPAI